ncbi:uncharacterized protein LOC143217965 [Lasioglossum baleicum]|uniref:uncharacterized protein LOC143217965 n=1 Tax=Lasioglossum baleicum TaxID=434251 RepID=UPI003FCE315B
MASERLRTSIPRKPFRELSCSQKRRVLNEIRTNLRSLKKSARPVKRPVNVDSVQDIPPSNISSSFAHNSNVESSREDSQAILDIDIAHDMPSTSSSSYSIPSRDDTARQSAGALSEPSFRERLATCFVDSNLTHAQVNNVLDVMRTHPSFSDFPKDARTMLRTPRTPVPTFVVEPGKYVHFGVETTIVDYLSSLESLETIPERLQLDFHVDGCTLAESNTIHLWPIQIKIFNICNSKPLVVGIYEGRTKPRDSNIYLQKFVSDINLITSNGGILFQGTRIPVDLRCLIADAPARAFILNHHGHNSRHPCSKCKVSGKWVDNRMVFLGVDHPLRKDKSYATRPDGDAHFEEGNTPLASLPMGMVSQVPFEYMHLVCLGVVKKLLSAWICGTFTKEVKLSANKIQIINDRMDVISNYYCPSEFARHSDTIQNFSKFKATEFRQFLLYTGPAVLKGVLDDNVYFHFLLLHSAIRILTSPSLLKKHLIVAKVALKLFVFNCDQFYGESFLSYNVHALLHLADDAERLGPLDSFSAFPYESNMLFFRKYNRKPDHILQQYANRRAEKKHCGSRKGGGDSSTTTVRASMMFRSSSGAVCYRKIQFSNLSLSIDNRNNCCILNDGSICTISSICPYQNTYVLSLKRFEHVDEFYKTKLSSQSFGIFKCATLSTEITFASLQYVKAKCFRSRWTPTNGLSQYFRTLENCNFIA